MERSTSIDTWRMTRWAHRFLRSHSKKSILARQLPLNKSSVCPSCDKGTGKIDLTNRSGVDEIRIDDLSVTGVYNGQSETGLCMSCYFFFHDESDERSLRTSGLPPYDVSSPEDWSLHEALLHRNLRLLETATELDCPICTLIFHAVHADAEKHDPRSSVHLSTNPGGQSFSKSEHLCHLIAKIKSPDSCAQCSRGIKIIKISMQKWSDMPLNNSLRGILSERLRYGDPGTDSPISFRLARWWLDECRGSHQSCDFPISTLPARVIDVGHSDGSQEPFLFESQKQKGSYVTLSYCWGNTIPFTTTSDTLADRKVRIQLSRMPKTFRDAVIIARSMDIRYLWIDALCILQDSFTDWERHSAKMCDIYRHALFTIAASRASDSSDGCFVMRDGLCYHPYLFKRPETSDCTSTWIATANIRPPGSVVDTPLFRRAWVYQEQMLSPRVLYYGSHGISWHCIESKATEKHPVFRSEYDFFSDFKQKYLSKSTGIADREGDKMTKTTWQEVVEEYTKRKLTLGKDKLAAILGVAELVQDVIKARIVAGLREDLLHQDLLWAVNAGYEPLHPPVDPPIAPSWSWAAVNYPVSYNGSSDTVLRTSDIRKLHIDGSASSQHGELVIRGLVRQALTVDIGLNSSKRLVAISELSNGNNREVLPAITWSPDLSLPPNTHIWLVEVLRTVCKAKDNPRYLYKDVYSLGLVPMQGPHGIQYRRVGMAVCRFSMVPKRPCTVTGLSPHSHYIQPDASWLERSILIRENMYWTERLQVITIV